MKRYKDIAGDGGSDIAGQVREQLTRLGRRLQGIRHVLAVLSGKGGVGKSSMTGLLAECFALEGWRVGVLDADLNGPSMAKILGVRGAQLILTDGAVVPPRSTLGISVMSMDLLLPSDMAPLTWQAPTQQEAHTWRATAEANALREFMADTAWGELDLLVVDLPPGTDRLATVLSLVPRLSGAVIVTIPSDLAQLVVGRSITATRQAGVRVLGLIENMTALFPGPDVHAMARESNVPVCGRVPFDPILAQTADRGEPFVSQFPNRPAALAILEAARTLRHMLVRGSG